MNSKKLYINITLKYLHHSISKLYYGVLLVVLVNFLIGLFVVLGEEANKNMSFVPISLFFVPAIVYFFVAERTKSNSLSYEMYLVIAVLYISLCLVEFYYGYSLDKLMHNFLSKEEGIHPMSYVLQLIPVLYKSFRLGLSVVFFRVGFLKFRYCKLSSQLK